MSLQLPYEFFEDDKPHSRIKRIMWKKYLQAFIAKTQQAKPRGYNSVICDVFAGTGIYAGMWGQQIDSYGSPLIALRVALDFFIKKYCLPYTFNLVAVGEIVIQNNYVEGSYRVKLFFNEKDTRNYETLMQNVDRMFRSYGVNVFIWCNPYCVNTNGKQVVNVFFGSTNINIPVCCQITNGDFEEIIPPVLSPFDRMVTFIDPFGFSQIPMAKVQQFAGVHKEVFINLMTSFINRFFEPLPAVITRLFGFELNQSEQLLSVFTTDRIDYIVNQYTEALGRYTGGLALTFEMRNILNIRLYHLIFMSTHIEGFKAMKEAMNRVTQEPDEFCLSDYNILRKNIPLNLGNLQKSEDVANCIFHQFHGQIVPLVDIENFVWLETPFVFRKEPLKILQNNAKIINVFDAETLEHPRIWGTFPDLRPTGLKAHWIITFAVLVVQLL